MNENLEAKKVWSDEDLLDAGIPVREIPFATIGGGLGSFALVDLLRMVGVPTSDIAIVSVDRDPQNSFQRLCSASQLGADGPLRSDSSSRIDNFWGFPGYALGAAWKRKSLGPLARVTTEPILAEYFTPTGSQVFDGVKREADRIGWAGMIQPGKAVAVRRRGGGGFFVIQETSSAPSSPLVAWHARYVHIAPGYPGVNIAPDLLDFRAINPGDNRTAHSYESHEHIYDSLAGRGGTVLIRGSGDTSAHLLHRLCIERVRSDSDIRIVHLIRDFVAQPTPFPEVGRARRPGRNGYSLQQFVFPRAAGGGEIARIVSSKEESVRSTLMAALGAPSKPPIRSWEAELDRGRREGWYAVHHGEVDSLEATPDGRIRVDWHAHDAGTPSSDLVDFIIDATGVVCGIEADPLLADMVSCGIGSPNPIGRLAVGPAFDLATSEPWDGRVYASGAITFGGTVIPVAVFWGLHYAALRICDDLARQGFCRRFTPWRSMLAWAKWVGRVRLP